MKRLRKNLKETTRVVEVDKDMYEKQIMEHKERDKIKREQRMNHKKDLLKKAHEFGLQFDEDLSAEWEERKTLTDYDHIGPVS